MTVLSQYHLVPSWVRACLAVLLAPAAALVAGEPDFDAAHRAAVAANPPGVTLTLSTDAPAGQFRLHAPLPLKLNFEFRDPKAFDFDDWKFSPDQARIVDTFYVTPTASAQRLESGFARQGGGVPGSGRPLDPGQTSPTVPAALDESFRFERPDKYRVYCTSRRVWKAGTKRPFGRHLSVTSNILEIEILPVPADELAAQLRQATDKLTADVPEAERMAAVHWLQRSDTEQAAHTLARAFGGSPFRGYEFDNAIHRALEESRWRPAIVQELERRLNDRDFGPSYHYLCDLARLDSELPSPTGSASKLLSDQQRQRYAKMAHDALYDRESLLLVAYADWVWRELPSKSPAARAAAAFALFLLRNERTNGTLPRDATFNWTTAQLRQMIQPAFLLLSSRDQEFLLDYYWRRLGGAPLAPALARLIERAPDKPPQPEYDDETRTLLDTACERLLTAAPDTGRRVIIAEIRREQPRLITATLLLLPDQPIAELDELLIARLERRSGADFNGFLRTTALVNRYASKAVLERVERVVRGLAGEGSAGAYPPLLCYWLKYAPQSGIEMVEQALGQRENGQHAGLLSTMASIRLAPELLPICLRRLNDPDQQVVESAVQALGMFGTPVARQALKDRLRRWHDELLTADPLVKEKIANEGYNGPHGDFDNSILCYLRESPLTVVTPQELRELRLLCMTKPALDNIDFALRGWTDPIVISFQQGDEGEFEHHGWPSAGSSGSMGTWEVAGYGADSKATLKALLARFPRGTTFALPTYVSTDPVEFQTFFNDLSEYVARRGMRLVKVVK
ncbi:MAG TPA: HEAT repeat domain-containing protein [Pirellulales bacterium]